MKKLIIIVYIIVFGMMYGADDTIKKSLVKIYSSHQQFDFQSPWQSGLDYNSTATGFVVDGNRILTNAHAVVNNKFLQIRKDGDSKKYKAKVKFISEEYDLAILEVEDKAFFNNTVPLKFGKLPNLRDKVTIYGYPLGGDKLSTTQGIVSRIEHNSYTLTNQRFLIGQTDAAINPGNSGGPVITNDKVIGVAFSGLMLADNIGYFIPVNIVEHFLTDIVDNKYDGAPKIGLNWTELESPAHRKMLGIADTSKGVLVTSVLKNSVFDGILQKNDVLLKLDSYDVDYDGTVEFRKNERTDFEFVSQQKNFGETLSYEIVRDKKRISGTVTLSKDKDPSDLIREMPIDAQPSYYLYGGLLFEPLSYNYLKTSYLSLDQSLKQSTKFEGYNELVVIVRVLSDDVNIGYSQIVDKIILKVNGQKYANFKDFVEKIANSDSEFIVFEDIDGQEIVLDRNEVKLRNKDILENYNISQEMSEDVR